MKKMLFPILLFCLVNTSVQAQASAVKILLDTETQRFAAMIARDTVQLRALLADELVYIHSNGLVESKKEHLQSIGSGHLVYNRMERAPDTRVRHYGKWAITNGIVQATGVLAGNPFDFKLRYTAVYNWKHGKWRLVNWQSTRLP